MPPQRYRAQQSALSPTDEAAWSRENQVIWVIWATYGAFYFCRANLAAAIPGMMAPVTEGGLGLTGDHVGTILGSLKITYGIGQLVNGQLSERLSPRLLLAIGMLCSAALNVFYGLGTAFYFLLFVWACNGYCQSLGWTPCVRILANWIPVHRRGRAIGIVGTGYQLTLGLTFLVSGAASEFLGWRAALYVPAAILAAAALTLLFLRESPQDAAAHESDESSATPGKDRSSRIENLLLTISNPALWLLALSLGLLNACRYGFVDWGITHLTEVQESGVGVAALKYVVLPIGAIAGSFVAGWATDRFFESRRAPVICILLAGLGLVTLMYESVARTSVIGTLFLLLVIGFCIFGPQVLLVGTAPADLARRGTSAAAAGFVNFMGYMGAALGDKVTGYYKMPEHGGWEVAIQIWAAWAFAAAITAGLLWNATSNAPEKD